MAFMILASCLVLIAGAANVRSAPKLQPASYLQGAGEAVFKLKASPTSHRQVGLHPSSFLVAAQPQHPQPVHSSSDSEKPAAFNKWMDAIVFNRRTFVAIGAVSGAVIGTLVHTSGIVDDLAYRSTALGGFFGAIAGLVCPLPAATKQEPDTTHKDRAPDLEKETAEEKPPKSNGTDNRSNVTGNVTEFAEPALEKLHQLGLSAVAVSDYEEAQAKVAGNETEVRTEKKAEKVAVKAVEDIVERINTTNKTYMVQNAGDFEDIQAVLSQGDTSEFMTAEAAEANNALITANDIARVQAGKNGSRLRGEDLGPAGDMEAFQGDMVPASKEQLVLFQTLAAETQNSSGPRASLGAGATWLGGKVTYCFASDVSPRVRHIFVAAVNQYQKAVPCLQFVDVGWRSGSSSSPESRQACNYQPAIFVQSHPAEGCYSYVGMLQGRPSQRLQLQDPGCESIGTALHELGHAVGMAHEQSRPDRDKHVRINWGNIQGGTTHNFDVDPAAYTGAKYDVLSIMHYDRFAFAVNPNIPSIQYVGHGVVDELGQRVGLSGYDVSQLVDMYKTEAPNCKGNALAGMGCINKPDDTGTDPCNIQKCNSNAAKHCCACGGGVSVQCYQGQTCPKSDPLPDLDAGDCIEDATNLFAGQGYPCIYTNVCKFKVAFTCPGLDCEPHIVGPKNYEAAMCNNQYQTKICSASSECRVFKV